MFFLKLRCSGEKFKEPNQESKDAAVKMPKNLGTMGGKANREPSRRNVKKLVKKPLNQFKVGLRMKGLQQSPAKCSRMKNQKERREDVGMDSPALPSLEKVNDIVPVGSTKTGSKSKVANVDHRRKNKRKSHLFQQLRHLNILIIWSIKWKSEVVI